MTLRLPKQRSWLSQANSTIRQIQTIFNMCPSIFKGTNQIHTLMKTPERWRPSSCPPCQYFCLKDLLNGSAVRVFTDRWTDGTESITSTADTGGNYAWFNYEALHGYEKKIHVVYCLWEQRLEMKDLQRVYLPWSKQLHNILSLKLIQCKYWLSLLVVPTQPTWY